MYMINEIPLTEWDFQVFITWGIRETVPNMAAANPNIAMLVITSPKSFYPYINLIHFTFLINLHFKTIILHFIEER